MNTEFIMGGMSSKEVNRILKQNGMTAHEADFLDEVQNIYDEYNEHKLASRRAKFQNRFDAKKPSDTLSKKELKYLDELMQL